MHGPTATKVHWANAGRVLSDGAAVFWSVRRATRQLDPRLGQVCAQLILLAILSGLDFGPSPLQALVYVACAVTADAMRARIMRTEWNWRGAISTGLSLSLLLRTHDPVLWVTAPLVAIGAKALLRIDGKHIFNPSGFAIAALLLTGPEVWVSPGQWGTRIWLVALASGMAFLILSRAGRLDIALTFLAARAALLFGRAVSLGDPLTIPLHQLQSGATLIFALYMLTDPRSTPDSRTGRIVFALTVAAVSHLLLFRAQLPEAPFYALILVSCASPLINRLLPGARFAWPHARGATVPCVLSPVS